MFETVNCFKLAKKLSFVKVDDLKVGKKENMFETVICWFLLYFA